MNTTTTGNRLHDLATACALLGGISRASLYRRIEAGDLRVVHVGRRVMVPQSEIDRLIDGQLANAPH